MTECRRCHRSITNPASVKHGFGRVCWSKTQKQDYSERPDDLTASPPSAILGTPGERVALLKAGMSGKAIEQEYIKANNFKIVNMLLYEPVV